MGAPIDPELTADAEEGGDVGPLGAGAGTSLHRQSPPRAPAPGGRQAQRRRAPAAQELPLASAAVDFRRAEGGAEGLHYCGDARDLLYTRRWRLIVAHPPCRAAALSNTVDLQARVANGELWFSMAFAVLLYCAPADVAVIEQPASQLERAYRAPDTRLQFLNYGVGYSKEWCLWHRGGDFSAPPPTTPGAAASMRAPHRIVQHDRAERERVRSRTPTAIADVLCRAINLEARRPSGQPLWIRRRALTRVAASPTEGPDDVQRCNDGAIINRWYRHAYASHPLDLETQRLLTATMPPFAGIRCAQFDLHSRPARLGARDASGRRGDSALCGV